MYVKFIDSNTVEAATRVIEYDGTWVSNPRRETLGRLGYKPLIEDERAEQTGNGYWREWYEETETAVIKHYEFVEVPDEPAEEPIEEPTEDPTPADGGDDLSASSESEGVPTEEGGE